MQKIGVLGAGAWGTALAINAVNAGRQTTLWTRKFTLAVTMKEQQENTVYLPGVKLPETLHITSSIEELADNDAILLVSPAQHTRNMVEQLLPFLKQDTALVICSKGIEVSSGKLLSDVLQETAPSNPVAVLSGPTFAIEVAKDLPCAITLAMQDKVLGEQLVKALGRPTFRTYYNPDIVGAQIGGAIKNVLAIATGIVSGLKIGENARAAVITRGLAEIARFGALFGAQTETLMGLSGLGDLILTCSSTQSRNMSLGKAIGEGQTFEQIMAGRNSVAEGAHTVEIVHKIAIDNHVDLPITAAVHRILKEGQDVKTVMNDLLARPFTNESA